MRCSRRCRRPLSAWRADFGRVDLVGFSGGAQFAHRFAMLYPGCVRRVVVAAAGWYTYIDPSRPFPLAAAPATPAAAARSRPTASCRCRCASWSARTTCIATGCCVPTSDRGAAGHPPLAGACAGSSTSSRSRVGAAMSRGRRSSSCRPRGTRSARRWSAAASASARSPSSRTTAATEEDAAPRRLTRVALLLRHRRPCRGRAEHLLAVVLHSAHHDRGVALGRSRAEGEPEVLEEQPPTLQS